MARYEKVAEELRKEVSKIIHDELKDPRLGFLTVMRVELTPDLRYAKIFYSVLGKEEDYAKTQKALDSAAGFIRRLIAQRIQLRFAPEIAFREDHSSEYSIRIEEVLNEIKQLTPPQPSSAVRLGKKTLKKGKRSEPRKSSRVRKKK